MCAADLQSQLHGSADQAQEAKHATQAEAAKQAEVARQAEAVKVQRDSGDPLGPVVFFGLET